MSEEFFRTALLMMFVGIVAIVSGAVVADFHTDRVLKITGWSAVGVGVLGLIASVVYTLLGIWA